MARLLRRQLVSRLRPPAVVAAPVVYRPVKVALADPQRPRQPATERAAHSRLRPPTAVGSPVVYRPLMLRLADPQRPRQSATARDVHSRLSAPAAVAVGAAASRTPTLPLLGVG